MSWKVPVFSAVPPQFGQALVAGNPALDPLLLGHVVD